MRLLCTLKDQSDTKTLSDYLSSQGISTEIDGQVNSDWGSPEYGTILYRIWVIDEDDAEKAYKLYEEYLADPSHARYKSISIKEPSPPPLPTEEEPPKLSVITPRKKPRFIPTPLTNFFLIICGILYGWSAFTTPDMLVTSSENVQYPVFYSPVKRELLYDYPKAYEIISNVISRYGLEALKHPESSPQPAQALLVEYTKTPFWQGYYDEVVETLTNKPLPKAPWFEKIEQGEVWRLVTPIFLHYDIFHLLFNMIWLFVLGRQLEVHLGIGRYLAFVLVAAVITNTAQYLMSGPNFLGFSGVLCAMLTFIWRRQVEAPWEGYQLQRSTFIFIMLFIVGMFVLQTISFIVEILTGTSVATYIANTAHLVGALVGLAFAKIPFFTHERWVK